MDILIVEDDAEIAEFLQRGLSAEGYRPQVAENIKTMHYMLARASYPIVILDRMLPDGDGATLCAELRASDPSRMILMLTALDATEEKIQGLRAGADDYVTKPFAFEELLVRIETLIRRAGTHAPERIVIRDLELDIVHKRALRKGVDLALTPTEFALLRYLAERQGAIASRMEILSGVWGKNFDPNTNLVEVYITYLRRKVDGDFDERLIRNVRGFGYVIDA